MTKTNARYHHGGLREALVECAIQTIAEAGVEALSLRALARDVGVSHSAPMRHFPTRADLLASIASQGVDSLVRSASEQAKDPDLTGLQKLKAMANGYVGWARANPVHHMILRNRDVMRHADEELRAQLAAYSALQSQTIAEAQNEGWRSDDPPRLILLQVVALTAGLAIVATDPLYKSALGRRPRATEIEGAVSRFFST